MKAKLISFIAIAILTTSCAAIMGVRKWKRLTPEQIITCAEKYKIDKTKLFYLDSLSFNSAFSSLKKTDKRLFKDLGQPLQLKIYDVKKDSQLINLINCYVGGYPNIKWNRAGSLNSFPPRQESIKRPDTLFNIKTDFKPFISLGNYPFNNISNFDYLIVVHWSDFMGRQSKNLIRLAKKYAKDHVDRKFEILYVNMDDVY